MRYPQAALDTLYIGSSPLLASAYDTCCSDEGLSKRLSSLYDLLERVGTDSLSNNPFREPPEAVVYGGIEAIKSYYKDLFDGGPKIQRCDIKVVIIGEAGAGKTR